MEAARVASVKGYEVVLFEKETTLGGQLNIASVPPRKSEMNRALRYLTNEMKELHVLTSWKNSRCRDDPGRESGQCDRGSRSAQCDSADRGK